MFLGGLQGSSWFWVSRFCLFSSRAQGGVPAGGVNAHCTDTTKCDANMRRTKQILGSAKGVINVKGKSKGKGGKQGKGGKGK